MTNFSSIASEILDAFKLELTALAGQSTEILAVAKEYYGLAKPVMLDIAEGTLKGISTDPSIKAEGISMAEGLIYLKREGKVCEASFISIEQIIVSDLQYDIKTLANKIISIFVNLLSNQVVALSSIS